MKYCTEGQGQVQDFRRDDRALAEKGIAKHRSSKSLNALVRGGQRDEEDEEQEEEAEGSSSDDDDYNDGDEAGQRGASKVV